MIIPIMYPISDAYTLPLEMSISIGFILGGFGGLIITLGGLIFDCDWAIDAGKIVSFLGLVGAFVSLAISIL